MNKKVIAFLYRLTDEKGELIDQTEGSEPFFFLSGNGQIIPGLETELLKLAVGDKRKIDVNAKDAYGERDENLVKKVARAQFPKGDITVGDVFRTDNEHGVVFVTEVTDSQVTIDGNHPLAGKNLSFEVELSAIRDATLEEIAHGHVHGPGGHHH